jgi:hypothetical protein
MVNPGGLFRCCSATIDDYCEAHLEEEMEPMVLDCKYEPAGNQKIELTPAGVWGWESHRFDEGGEG